MVCIYPASISNAQESYSDPFRQNISLDLRNIDIIEALKFLAMKTKLNIIYTKSVSGRVTLSVEDVPIKDVFDIMLRSNGLAYDKKGDIYNVMTEAEYKALYGKNFTDPRRVEIFHLDYAIPDQAFNLLDTLKSEIGRVLVDSESGNVMVMDIPEKIKQMHKALEQFEKKNMIEVFDLKYAKAKDVEETLKTQLDSKKAGSVKADERTNQVIVQTLPRRMREIERLIASLDTQTKEVLIDTKVIKIKLSNQKTTGLEWEGIFNVAEKYGMTYLGSTPFSTIQTATDAWRPRTAMLSDSQSASPPGTGGDIGAYPFSGTINSSDNFSSSTKVSAGERIHMGIVDNKRDFDLLIKYLQTIGKTQILSNPKIAVVNNQEAKIHVGERQAYVTSTTTTGQTTSTISEEVTFVDVGIKLSVTPTINSEGFITMQIKPEVSSVVSTLVTSQGNQIPIVDTSLAETTVMVKDGVTIVIGGLRKEEKTRTTEQFPFLSRIPLLGFLFHSGTNKIERTELLVMLTPHIISGRKLDVGDRRVFGTQPGKEYRDYRTPFSGAEEIERQMKFKPYRNYLGLGKEEMAVKAQITNHK
jgi:type IV pilus assembly protein PilQ